MREEGACTVSSRGVLAVLSLRGHQTPTLGYCFCAMAIAPSAGAAAGATFGTLAFFLIFTLVAGRKGLLKFDPDEYMSARNSQGTFALTMSFFASGAGAWVLFTVPEAAILGGPIAVLGYALSCILPLLIYSWAAPYLRKNLPFGITFFEFVQARHGPQ